MQDGHKFHFHICEHSVTCQTFIKYLLCARHGIKAPQICYERWSLFSKNLLSTQTLKSYLL